jgi:hypothetical protein
VLRGAIGEAIEALDGAPAGEQAAILAYHYARSLHHEKAVQYSLLAGDQAMRLHAPVEAAISYGQALTLARRLPETPEAQHLQIDAILKLASVSLAGGFGAGSGEPGAGAGHGGSPWGRALSRPRALLVGRIAYVRGNLSDALPLAEQSLAIADRLADETLSAPPANLLGRIYTMRWDVARASELLARSTEQMHRIGNLVEEATAAGMASLTLLGTASLCRRGRIANVRSRWPGN